MAIATYFISTMVRQCYHLSPDVPATFSIISRDILGYGGLLLPRACIPSVFDLLLADRPLHRELQRYRGARNTALVRRDAPLRQESSAFRSAAPLGSVWAGEAYYVLLGSFLHGVLPRSPRGAREAGKQRRKRGRKGRRIGCCNVRWPRRKRGRRSSGARLS